MHRLGRNCLAHARTIGNSDQLQVMRHEDIVKEPLLQDECALTSLGSAMSDAQAGQKLSWTC